jgi:hypothetical protein
MKKLLKLFSIPILTLTFFVKANAFVEDNAVVIPSTGGGPLNLNWADGVSQKYSLNVINVKEKGCKVDGTTNDTAALQTILNGITQDSVVFIPTGVMIASGTVTYNLTYRLSIKGNGKKLTQILQTYASTNTFVMATSAHIEFHDFWLKNQPVVSTGTGIQFLGSGGVQVEKPLVDNVMFEGQWNAIESSSTSQFTIKNCDFINGYHAEILADDALSNDSQIEHCFFNTGISTTNSGIQITDSPGIRITGNKILGYKYGIFINLSSATSTFNIVGNSLENQATAGIFITTQAAIGHVGSIVISGNELASHPYGIWIDTMSNTIENLAISANTFNASQDGIHISGGAHNFTIGTNDFLSGVNGIWCGGNFTGTIGGGGSNGFYGVATPINGCLDYGFVNGGFGVGGSTSSVSVLTVTSSSNQSYLKQANNDNGWIASADQASANWNLIRRGEGGSPSNTTRLTVTSTGTLNLVTSGLDASTSSAGWIVNDSETISWFSSHAPTSGKTGEIHYCSNCANASVCVSTAAATIGAWAATTGNRTTVCN